ncbi:hypothetical protein C2S51_012027 [Perilla frutescens var. frutescens]|nr:hypothetical protein C2S51_012027 [Perilla frutescens var. frutescens]
MEIGWGYCLADICLGRFPGVNTVEDLANSWPSKPKVSCHINGLIFFRFKDRRSMLEIHGKGPYSIYKRPVILHLLTQDFSFEKLIREDIQVWVNVHNIPMEFWNTNVLGKIASRVGTPIMIDTTTYLKEKLDYARILVAIKPTNEPPMQLEILSPDGYISKLEFQYDFLPKLCLEYNRLLKLSVASKIIPEDLKTLLKAKGIDEGNQSTWVEVCKLKEIANSQSLEGGLSSGENLTTSLVHAPLKSAEANQPQQCEARLGLNMEEPLGMETHSIESRREEEPIKDFIRDLKTTCKGDGPGENGDPIQNASIHQQHYKKTIATSTSLDMLSAIGDQEELEIKGRKKKKKGKKYWSATNNFEEVKGGRILVLWNSQTTTLEVVSSTDQVIHYANSFGARFTWSKDDGSIRSKLDRVMINNAWLENEWECKFLQLVEEEWYDRGFGTAQFLYAKKLEMLQRYLRELNKNEFEAITVRASEAKAALETVEANLDANPMDSHLRETTKELRKNALFLVEAERQFYSQKAKCKYFLENDRNTKFFHSTVKRNRKKNNITLLMHENGGDYMSVEILLKTLLEFEVVSGLQVNMDKSALFMAGLSGQELESIQQLVGFLLGIWPVRYLSIPIATKRLTTLDYSPLINKIAEHINSWSAKTLSYAERTELVRSVLQVTTPLWSVIKDWLNIRRGNSTILSTIKWCKRDLSGSSIQLKAKKIALAAAVYFIWKTRLSVLDESGAWDIILPMALA